MSNTKITNVIGVPIPQWLINQFNERANQHGQSYRDTDSLIYLSNKSAWVRAVSSVNVEQPDIDFFSKNYGISQKDATSLAKTFILFAGTSKYRKEDNNGFGYDLRSGLGGSYGMLGDEEVKGYGYQPMPGISSVNIETSGRMGSVRMATINFKVFNKMQLDIVDALYFKLGYTLFLEWGNTCYYETNAESELSQFQNSTDYKKAQLKYSEDLSIDPFEQDLTKEKINYRIAQNVKESCGNYDGMLGVITNFNFTRKEDSTYDCSVRIIGLGALAESIKINRSDVFVDILRDELKKIVALANNRKLAEIKKLTESNTNTINSIKEDIKKKEEQVNQAKTINEIYAEKIIADDPLKTGGTIDQGRAKNVLQNFFTYLPSDSGNAPEGDLSVSDIVYPPGESWAIRRLGYILEEGVTINSIALDVDKMKSIALTPDLGARLVSSDRANRPGFFSSIGSGILSAFGIDTEDQLVYRKIYSAFSTISVTNTKIKRLYEFQIIIDKSVFVKTEYVVNPQSTSGGAPVTTYDYTILEKLGNEIYKDLTGELLDNSGQRKPLQFSDELVYGIEKIDPTDQTYKEFTVTRYKNASEGYRPYIKVKRLISVDKKDIYYNFVIYDSSLISSMVVSNQEITSRELLAINTKKEIEERKADIAKEEAKKNEAQAQNPLIDVKKVQDIEVAKYASSLETILRGIQTYSLNKATDTVTSVVKIPIYDTLGPKVFGNVGLYSTMYNKILNGTVENIIVDKNNGIYEIAGSKTQQAILEYFANYGFNHNVMSGKTKGDDSIKVNHKELLESYVIPHQVSQEFAEGVTMNRPVFIKFGTLLMILNHVSLIYDVKDITQKSNRTPVIYIDYNPNTNFCLASPNHLSTNPINFMIPYNGSKEDFKKLFDAEIVSKIDKIFDPSVSSDNGYSRALPEFRNRKDGGESAYQGKIMNVLVDIQYLLNTIKRFSTSDSTNSVYLKSFLEAILSDMTKAFGNFNIFRLAYDDESNCLYVVDDQLTPGDAKEERNYRLGNVNRTEIPLYGKMSIAKSVEIKTDISSKLANMIAISSNAPSSQGSLSTDASSFGFVNSKFTDRYIPLKEDVDNPKKQNKKDSTAVTDGDEDVAQSFNDAIKSFYGKVDIAGDAVSVVTNYYIARMSRYKNETSASRASVMIPVSVNFITDGVSGFGMYQSFTINDELLPYTYSTNNRNDGKDEDLKKVGFCVVGLSHTIDNNQWNTSVRAQMVYLKDKTDYQIEAIKQDLPFGPAGTTIAATPAASGVQINTNNFRQYYPNAIPSIKRGISNINLRNLGLSPLSESEIIDATTKNVFSYPAFSKIPEYFIIHHTVSGGTSTSDGADSVMNYFSISRNPTQFVIGRTGIIYRYLPDGMIGQHARGDINSVTLGVEIVAWNNNDVLDVQVNAALRLVHYYGFNVDRVLGHGKVNFHKEADEGYKVVSKIDPGYTKGYDKNSVLKYLNRPISPYTPKK